MSLTKREAEILMLRYGIRLEEKITLDKLGKRYGVSSGRIGQIERKAARKLRKDITYGYNLIEILKAPFENDEYLEVGREESGEIS